MGLIPVSRFEEIVMKAVPAISSRSANAPASKAGLASDRLTQHYDVLIYGKLETLGVTQAATAPPGQANTMDMIYASLPLALVEHLVIDWNSYRPVLAAFFQDAASMGEMRSLLLKALSPGIQALASGQGLHAHGPVRIWIASETPELEDLPWELVAYDNGSPPSMQLSFVRGFPGEFAPLVPIDNALRLAFIYDPASTPEELRSALMTPIPGLEVTEITGPGREALQQAAQEGFELVHIVADGSVSLAYEGIIEWHSPNPAKVAPSELCALMHGSRVTIIGLTSCITTSGETWQMGGHQIPAVYRAFVYLGNSRQMLPTIVAPLGPLDNANLARFWRDFYTTLAANLSVEDALGHAQTTGQPAPVALFLRHRLGREFVHSATSRDLTPVEPTQINAELQTSRDLVSQLRAIQTKYGSLPDTVNRYLDQETARQGKLDDTLGSYRVLDEGKP